MRKMSKYFQLILVVLILFVAPAHAWEDRVVVSCPVEFGTPSQDTIIEIPIYCSNLGSIGGFSLGFRHNSPDIEIDAISTAGTVLPPQWVFTPLLLDLDSNTILVGAVDFSSMFPLLPQDSGLVFTLLAKVPAGTQAQCIDIDSSWVPPAGDFIFSPLPSGQVTPNYYDCGTCDIQITAPAQPPVALCQNITVDANDNCEAGASIDDGSYDPGGLDITLVQEPEGPYPLGDTQVKLIVTNTASLADTCEATVTVEDNTSPLAICPGDTTLDNAPGECGASVSFNITATDNCSGVSVIADPESNSFFSVGTTPVEVIATDASGNADTCYFDVTVNDIESPTISCVDGIERDNDPGECGATVDFATSASTADDNCGTPTITYNPPSGSFFNTDTTWVMGIAADAAGNADTCEFFIYISDREAPVITCPDEITVDSDPGECGAIVDFSATATDNCTVESIAYDPASGSFFDVGITVVQAIATDAAGNADTCSFNVEVIDAEEPVITCPADTAIQIELGETEAIVVFTVTATDNCPGVTVVAVPPSGSSFPLGETIVNCTATDAEGKTDFCSFKITIIPPNYPPEARDTTITTDEDIAVAANLYATDPEDDPLWFEFVAGHGPDHGTITDFDSTTGAFTYNPAPDYNGPDSIGFVAHDLTNQSNEATVRITVNPINDEPVPRDTSITTDEDTPVSAQAHAYDVDGDVLTYTVENLPDHGTLTAFDEGTGAFTYEPDANYNGPDEFSFSVSDLDKDRIPVGTVSITVTPINDPPVANDGAFSVDEDQLLQALVDVSDVDKDDLTYEVVSGPTHGAAEFTDPSDPLFSYQPDTDYNGDDSFTYRAYDGQAYSNTATIDITIDPINDNPVPRDTTIIVIEDTPSQGQCQAYDVDGDPLTFGIDDGPYNGTLSNFDEETGTFTYTPDPGYLGDDSLTFWVDDMGPPTRVPVGKVRIKVVEPAFFTFSADSLFFAANEYASNPAAQRVGVTSASPTGEDFDWISIETSDWLALSAESGTTPSDVDFSVDINGLLPGVYRTNVYFVVVLLKSASGGPRDTVVVTLTIENPVSYDSVAISHETAEPGQEVLVTLTARNSAPTYIMKLPISYDPDILIYNHTNFVETRLEHATAAPMHYEYKHLVDISAVFHEDILEPGSGPIAFMSFTIKPGVALGSVAILDLLSGEDFNFVLDNDHGSAVVIPTFTAGSVTVDQASDVDDNNLSLPNDYALNQNYPNPFNPETIIEYSLPHAAVVRLSVYNILGQKVTDLVNEYQTAGSKQAVWDGTDNFGKKVESGVYFYRLTTSDFDLTRKMILMK